MKIVESVLERRMQTLISLNKMQFGFMLGKETVDGIFIVRRMQDVTVRDLSLFIISRPSR